MGCAVNSRSFVDLFFKRCDWFVLFWFWFTTFVVATMNCQTKPAVPTDHYSRIRWCHRSVDSP